jgi:hypothetical protein
MVSPSMVQRDSKHLSPLNTNWHNRSMSSISAISDAATFHSAHAHHTSSPSNMELHSLTQRQLTTLSMTKPMPSPKLEAIRMNRQDSGYSDAPAPTSPVASSHRRSTSSSRPRSPSKPKRRTTASSANSGTRPSTKRASRSSAQIRTSTSGARPSMQSRHTTSYSHSSHHTQPYQFFQFPTFSSPSAADDNLTQPPPPPPPPATIQYWTSDSTRRLEYAAIDAASKGVRGFFIKLVPDCILPQSTRRTKFCDGDEGSDAGSVRRYRLQLPEEKESSSSSSRDDLDDMGKGSRPKVNLLRRWTSFGRSRC